MKAPCLVLAAASLIVVSAQAQLVEPDSKPQLKRQDQPQDQAFARSYQPPTRPYITNETEDPNAKLFGDYRTDPKLRLGFDLNPYFAIETGYQNLHSRGFHYVDPGNAAGRAGAVGAKGSASFLAGKLTLPIGGRLSTFGKLGVVHSDRATHDDGLNWAKDVDVGRGASVDVGRYANFGANTS